MRVRLTGGRGAFPREKHISENRTRATPDSARGGSALLPAEPLRLDGADSSALGACRSTLPAAAHAVCACMLLAEGLRAEVLAWDDCGTTSSLFMNLHALQLL